MKFLLAISIPFLLSSFSFIENNKTVFTNQKISIEATTQGCNDTKNGINREFIFLSFTNKTAADVEVSYYTELFYNGNCATCSNKEEYTFKLVIPANSTVSGDCANKNQSMALFSKMLDGVKASELTNYSIKNVTVKTK